METNTHLTGETKSPEFKTLKQKSVCLMLSFFLSLKSELNKSLMRK